MPHLPSWDAIAAYIFSWGDMNNIFVFSVLFIVLLHMQLCVVFSFFMSKLQLSCRSVAWALQLQLGRYPAGQIERRCPVGPIPYSNVESKPATFKTEVPCSFCSGLWFCRSRLVHPQMEILFIPISQAKRCRFVRERGEREQRSGWRKLALKGSRAVWQKQNICSSQTASSVPPV